MNRKTIIVTGGAQGIGKAIVYELAKEKHNVILNYNKSEKEAKQIKDELTHFVLVTCLIILLDLY